MTECIVPPCDREAEARGLCPGHRSRERNGGDMTTALRSMSPKRPGEWGPWAIDSNGYRRRQLWNPATRKPVAQLEHRVVMQEKLGREMVKGENVHHINGNRSDNRPENLELWVTSQPSGQRPVDLVAYAREILDRYA